MPRAHTVVAAAVAAGLALTQHACSADAGSGAVPPASAPAASPASPQPSAPSSSAPEPDTTTTGTTTAAPAGDAGPVLGGKRQVVIKPVGSFESILGVDEKGRLTAIDGTAPHTLFVLVPAGGGKHLIRTATGDAGGEPSCLGIKGNGSNPLTVVAAACDTRRAGQLFSITRADGSDDGEPTYAINNQGAFVQLSPQHGVIAEELGDSPLRTTYTFVDNGAAPAGPGS